MVSTTISMDFANVGEGIVMQYDGKFYRFFKLNGNDIQIAESSKYPVMIGKLVWDNWEKGIEKAKMINGYLIKKYL